LIANVCEAILVEGQRGEVRCCTDTPAQHTGGEI
jgi:hypothetical protein